MDDNARFLAAGPPEGPTLLLAHGAGAPMDSAFMEAFAGGLAAGGIRVLRFEFPYMAERRASGKRRPPDREAVLLNTWRSVTREAGDPGRVLIGGKSMGGRMASMVADELEVAGLVCLGYPFHAPGRPDRPRTAHLAGLRTPALIVQGTRDPFGRREEIEAYLLSPRIAFHWVEDGDHDLVPRVGSGRSAEESRAAAIEVVARFVRERLTGR